MCDARSFARAQAIRKATGARVEREIFPAGTDSQFLRAVGIPAVGFSPLPGTPILLHEHNEALSVQTFLDGIATYVQVIEALAGAERQPAEGAAALGLLAPLDGAGEGTGAGEGAKAKRARR